MSGTRKSHQLATQVAEKAEYPIDCVDIQYPFTHDGAPMGEYDIVLVLAGDTSLLGVARRSGLAQILAGPGGTENFLPIPLGLQALPKESSVDHCLRLIDEARQGKLQPYTVQH